MRAFSFLVASTSLSTNLIILFILLKNGLKKITDTLGFSLYNLHSKLLSAIILKND